MAESETNQELLLNAVVRTEQGKGACRRLRRQGQIPAIVYGPHMEQPQPVAVDPKELRLILQNEGRLNALLKMKLEGGAASGERVVLLKDHQVDPLTQDWTHADFIEVNMNEEVSVTVTLHYVGKAKGAVEGGVLEVKRRQLNVLCLPTDIPKEINVDISELDIGDNLHIKDIELPKGVTSEDDAHLTLVTLVPPAKEEATPAEAETAAEGDPATGDEGSEPAKETKDAEK